MTRKAKLKHAKQLKQVRKQQERTALQKAAKQRQLHEHIEKMNAAYIKETKIPAHSACLVHEVEETKDPEGNKTVNVKYWFEHHEKRAKILDLHPDTQFLFELAYDMHRANTELEGAEKEEKLKEGFNHLDDIMSKYKDIIETEAKEMWDKQKGKK